MPECGVRPPLRFQVLSLPNVPWLDLKQRFVRLEELGIEVAALADHFVDWTNPPSPWFESWTALTGLAAATKSIRLTSCVTQIPLRNPAIRIGRDFAVCQDRGMLWSTHETVEGGAMARTNLTLQLDEDVIRRARVVAAKRGTSVSAMVARELDALVEQDVRYEEAQRRAQEIIREAIARGGRSWRRDELHDR